MKLITRDTDYAMRVLCAMAKQKGKVISTEKLMYETEIPRPFLRKILQILNKKRIIRSYKGKNGGFMLSKNLNNICIADIIKVFQGTISLSEHVFKKGKCPRIQRCNLKKRLDKIEAMVREELNAITVASLMN